MPSASAPPLGRLAPASFLARYWHKDALAMPGALPGFDGFFTRDDLFALAMRDDVESRLVVRDGRRWSLAHGPFVRRDLAGLPPRNWTLLVQGTNLHDARADALLRRFAFVPYARLDDLMVSYAAPGGGVGPHFDSYDVFLLQGFGRRRWRWGPQQDLTLRAGLPLKVLARFKPSHDRVFEPGDLLYLPPHHAHDGVALDACTTYSIGFRAPSSQELASAFLEWLADHLQLEGRYADPDLRATREPARIGTAMQRRVAKIVDEVRWDRASVARFLGCWLSEPKPVVAFDPPGAPMTRAAFGRAIARRGVALDLRSQMLYDDDALYANGEAIDPPKAALPALRTLANARRLPPDASAALPADAIALLHDWYRHGWIAVDDERA